MPLTAKQPGGQMDYTPPPEGVSQAACYLIADLGTQHSEKWDKDTHQVAVGLELTDERIEYEKDGKQINAPMIISNVYTLSLHQKSKLRQHLEMWRNSAFTEEQLKGFDLKNVLGANCCVQILHKKVDDRVYANIVGITPLMKHMEKKEPENPLVWFSFEEDNPIPGDMPEWIVNKIQSSTEYAVRIGAEMFEDEQKEDPITF